MFCLYTFLNPLRATLRSINTYFADLGLAVAVTGVVDAVGLEHLVQLGTPDLLVLAAKQLVGGEVAVEVLLDVVHAPLVCPGLNQPGPGGGALVALHLVFGAAKVQPRLGPATGRYPLPAPLPDLLIIPETERSYDCQARGHPLSLVQFITLSEDPEI